MWSRWIEKPYVTINIVVKDLQPLMGDRRSFAVYGTVAGAVVSRPWLRAGKRGPARSGRRQAPRNKTAMRSFGQTESVLTPHTRQKVCSLPSWRTDKSAFCLNMEASCQPAWGFSPDHRWVLPYPACRRLCSVRRTSKRAVPPGCDRGADARPAAGATGRDRTTKTDCTL